MKLFVSGSQSIKNLPETVRSLLQRAIERNREILVGDANGVDRLVQEYCKNVGYSGVTVYHIEGKARNNLNDWPTHPVSSKLKTKNFRYFVQKDEAMAAEADVGLMIWDLESAGTFNNVMNILKDGKKATIYIVPRDELITVETFEDAKYAFSLTPEASKEKLKKKLGYPANFPAASAATQQPLPI